MDLSKLNTIISLLFAPLFVLGITFYPFESVAFVFTLCMFLYFLLALLLKQDLKEISTPLIYLGFLIIAYSLSSITYVKMIPALISLGFFLLFLNAYIRKKKIILSFANKFYPKKLNKNEQTYLKNSDGYWAFALGINFLIQVALVLYKNHVIWAFYSSIGWYIYLGAVFILHLGYGKYYTAKLQRQR